MRKLRCEVCGDTYLTAHIYEPGQERLCSKCEAWVEENVNNKKEKTCLCGSGLIRKAVIDARGIFVTYVCDECRDKKLSKFRDDIFTDPQYPCDEPIDDDYYYQARGE